MASRPATAAERATWPTTSLVDLSAPFVDDRGAIQPLVDMAMKSCVLIRSKKGSVRANHYHKTDWHFCYVLEGAVEYYHRPHGSAEQAKLILVPQGQMIFTPPMEEHAMVFTDDTLLLTLGRDSRLQEAYESGIVRITPIHQESPRR